ncbi:MAG: RNA 2',3'-cyclic phosphodiesterase [Verrucomicrobiota bacterium]|nr:RNA 2',3'-cyclic phosphodiesterase [Verrucomicrobiota bacterium]
MDEKRLFVAIALPDAITDLLASMDPHLPAVRWLRAEQIHLTLSFLGGVDSQREELLRTKLAAVRFTRFFLPIVGLGTFPAKGKPRVIWTGIGKGHPQLFHVYQRVQEAALATELEPDLRAWHPHITIARGREVAPHVVQPFLKKHADFDAGLVPIESFALYSSRPGPLGSAYTRELEVRATRSA